MMSIESVHMAKCTFTKMAGESAYNYTS